MEASSENMEKPLRLGMTKQGFYKFIDAFQLSLISISNHQDDLLSFIHDPSVPKVSLLRRYNLTILMTISVYDSLSEKSIGFTRFLQK